MICWFCTQKKHEECPANTGHDKTWCDCQHREGEVTNAGN